MSNFRRSITYLFLALPAFLVLVLSTTAVASSDEPDPEEIIRRFAEKETEFREVWQQYTYTQQISFQVLGRSNQVKERRDMVVEVYFTSDGQRDTRVISDQGQLYSVGVTEEDLSDALSMQPFVLTTAELEKYKIKYEGKELIDELDLYVFDVEPKKKRRGERYFEGRIFVDDLDFQIVMTQGKIVPDLGNNKFPKFETIREQIDGDYWFPTWTEADDILRFGSMFAGGRRDVHVRQLITYGEYQRYEVGTSIKYGGVADDEDDSQGPR
jgi:hypothetical protein